MTILGLCFDSAASSDGHWHDPYLVTLSVCVALLASFCALVLAERWRTATGGRARTFWLFLAGVTLGAGVWAMHFIGMTAFNVPHELGYRLDLTFLSGVVAITAATAGLAIVGHAPSPARLGLGGAVVGLGVATMHYMGMEALIVPGQVVYRPDVFALSVVIAFIASTAALWLAINVKSTLHRVLAATVMAIAICGMHYTAMSGAELLLIGRDDSGLQGASKGFLAALVAVAVVALLCVGLVLAYLDRRMQAQAVSEAERLRAMNADLEQARREAEAASLAKSQFLATMSHEIRTPMNGVLNMLEVALRDPMDAQQRDRVTTAHASAVSLLQILNDILDYSKLEAGKLDIETLPCSIRQLADETASMLMTQANAKGVSLNVEVDGATPDWIEGDPTRLRQILLNLVSNAVKFTHKGGVSIYASVVRDGDGSLLRVAVRDTGVGITEEARARLFARFAQADASTTRRFGGTGLGLAICRELVARMGGDIGVDSTPGEGSTFWFTLPTRACDAPDWNEPAEIRDRHALAPLNILVAEDNPVNQKVLRALMSGQPHTLTFANNGAQAVSMVQNAEFDLILMDVSMPVMDGPTATRAIRAQGGLGETVPIIALTANAMAGDRETYIAAGMNDYVAKPISLDKLLEAIARHAPLHARSQSPVDPAPRNRPAAPQTAEPPSVDLSDLIAAIDAGKSDAA
ncbi:MAG: MHYT domain-containing protein [Hyphomonadaceae bacterium]